MMSSRTIILCALVFVGVCLFGVFESVRAQSNDDFLVNLRIGVDTTPPTIPGNLSATPTSQTTIDLDWDDSFDDYGVLGYQVFRDATQIATTSLSSFADSGLTASTTYSYYVTAFDSAYNFSTATPAVATTTLQLTPTTTSTTTEEVRTGSTLVPRFDVSEVVYEATTDSIRISFTTTVPALTTIRWGRTANYEGGLTMSDVYRTEHTTLIDGLQANTVYEIEILTSSRTHPRERRETLTIRTLPGPDTEPPTNPSNFDAWLQNGRVSLSWENPADPDFSHVRVLSSDQFYPSHIADGWLVFDGEGERAFDDRPIPEGQKRYYTIFAYDEAGNISSGAVTAVTHGLVVRPIIEEGVPTSTRVYPPTFGFSDVQFYQDEDLIEVEGERIRLNAHEATTVVLPYELVPERLKSIIVTLEHPDNPERVFSVLLRINPDKTAYEARIGPLEVVGEYPVSVNVFDLSIQELFTVAGTVEVYETAFRRAFSDDGIIGIGSARDWTSPLRVFLFLAIVFLLLFFFFLLFARRRAEYENG